MTVFESLVTALTAEGYFDIKPVANVVCGLHDYMTTRGIVVGLTELSYERRYCYQNRQEASQALLDWTNPNEHPPGNWIKVKGRFQDQAIDMLNPLWSNS